VRPSEKPTKPIPGTGQRIGRWVPKVAGPAIATCAIASLAIAAASCGSDSPPAPRELIASLRSEPATYNRYLPSGSSAAVEVVTLLTQARLVRVNRVSDELEPWLAESWSLAGDGISYTLTLRDGIKFSDGQPLTTEDVLFSFRVAYEPAVKSGLAVALQVNGKPLAVAAVDARTMTIRMPEPFAPGLRLLENLPVLPKHKLQSALDGGTFAQAWSPSKPLTDLAGLGPFVLAEHVTGQRLVFTRNPNYFRRDATGARLPYLDRLTIAIVPDQNTEALRLEAGEIDLMSNGDIRPQDHAAFRKLAEQGRLRMMEVGVGLDPDFLAFNLRPPTGSRRAAWLDRREVRQAISCGVDRQAIVNTVYLGAAVPIYGGITPGNKRWHWPAADPCAGDRATRAKQLLASAGLTDRNGDGMLEDPAGGAARFAVLTHGGHLRERVVSVLQQHLRQLGLAVDIVPLDPQGLFARWQQGDYDAIYFGLQASSTDPALNPDFWFSSGAMHFWNPRQKTPATPWEARVDALMREQATSADLPARQKAFAEVQRILGEELPMIYFVAPKVTLATTPRVGGASPSLQIPHLLWAADTLTATATR
jgi:peptide/nickel transport system substrate-binding protein